MSTSYSPMPVVESGKTRVIVHLSNDLLNKYDSQAKDCGISLEELLSDRMRDCVSHKPGRNLFLNNDLRTQLEVMLNSALLTPELVISNIRRALAVRVNDAVVELQPGLLERLKSRHFEGSFTEFLKTKVVEGLETYVGMR